ncbi:WD40/YVTN/BNR-like repeat-containing protein, partial [Salmonella enterica]|uniref:WD40/YVTN/BNR-like repeat-containing protein n=1 Tax=Salmonella enterica TaxID=28901 RepID=UPI0032B5D130
LVLTSTDGGTSWAVRHKGTDSLFGLAIAPDGDIFVAGQEGVISRSHDGGATWTDLNSGTKTVLTSIIALPDGRLVA